MRRVAGAADGLLLAELEFRRLLPPDPYSPRCTVRGRTIGQARPTCAPTLDILWVAIVRTINTPVPLTTFDHRWLTGALSG
jgi:hypothetical protein